MPCFAIGDRPLERLRKAQKRDRPERRANLTESVGSRTILKNSAIFLTFANVCSHSGRPILWSNLWSEGPVRCIGVEAGGLLHRVTHMEDAVFRQFWRAA